MKKRLLAILLSLMMVLSLLPVGVFAADAKGIGTGAELAELFTKANAGVAGSGDVTVKIDKDYNLTGYDWTSLTVDGYQGAGIVTVEGNSHTITGLNAPLFAGGFAGTSGIVVKNLTLTNVTINDSTSDQGIGAFINNVDSMPTIELDNCHLTDSKITSTGGARVGGLIGWTSGYNKKDDGPVDTYITVKNCSVENTEITAKGSVGGIIGHAGCNPATFHTFTDNTVTGCTLKSTDNGGWRVGVVVGTANVGEVALNNTIESGNTVTQTGKTAPAGQSNLYGRFVPGTTGKLVIDGVPVFNSDIVAAIGNTGYKTLADAVTAADKSTVTLLKDVTEDITIPNGKNITLDLNGHKLSNFKSHTITNNGLLTINDSVGNGKIENNGNECQTVYNNPGAVAVLNAGSYDKPNTHGYVVLNHGHMTANKDVKMTIWNKTHSSLFENGWQSYANNKTSDKSELIINGGTYEGGLNTIKNDDDGVLIINDGMFKNYTQAAFQNHNIATVKGGTFDGASVNAVLNCGANCSVNNDHDKHELTIENGYFKGKISKNFGTITISGGMFSSKPAKEYIANGYYVNVLKNGEYPYIVNDEEHSDETLVSVKDVAPKTEIAKDITDDNTKTAIESVQSKTSVQGVGAAVFDNKDTLVKNSDVKTEGATEVKVEVKVNVTVNAADLTSENKTMTFEAKPVATVTTIKEDGTQVDKKEGIEVPNGLLNGEITVTLPLPMGFDVAKLEQVKHISGNSVEYFLKTPKTGAKTFEIDKDSNCVILKITHFSTFELSTKSDYVEPVYTSAPITKKDVKFDDVDVNAYYAPAVKWAVENKITAGKTDKLFAPDDTCTRGEMITFLWNAAGKPAAKNTTNPFTDVNAGAFYYDAVLWAVSNGITSGTTDTTFSPDNTVSRAQVVAFLYNYANKPAAANSTFTDVAADAYYAPAVGWAAAQKITSGTGNNTFSPENDCTRAQIVTFLYNDLAK